MKAESVMMIRNLKIETLIFSAEITCNPNHVLIIFAEKPATYGKSQFKRMD
jgi:hypothetical protein